MSDEAPMQVQMRRWCSRLWGGEVASLSDAFTNEMRAVFEWARLHLSRSRAVKFRALTERKLADQMIVGDVQQRLATMDQPVWTQAVLLSWNDHPDWYRHHVADGWRAIEQLLRDAGVPLLSGEQSSEFGAMREKETIRPAQVIGPEGRNSENH